MRAINRCPHRWLSTKTVGGAMKTLQCVLDLAIHPVTVESGSLRFQYPGIEQVGLSPKLWRRDNCLDCGRCCKRFTLAYTEPETDRVPAAHLQLFQPDILRINGRKTTVFLHPQTRKQQQNAACDFREGSQGEIGSGSCSIHEFKPLHCRLPHIRIQYYERKERTLIRRGQYGRNWALGCPVHFTDGPCEKQVHEDIALFKELDLVAKHARIKTVIPMVIEWMLAHLHTPPSAVVWLTVGSSPHTA